MDYLSIHDAIIDRALNRTHALNRTQSTEIRYEKHHLLPRCEGGENDGPLVNLTHKEHMIVHRLRFKITNVWGNLYAYNLLKYGELTPKQRKQYAKIGAYYYHTKYREENPKDYLENQKYAGHRGGMANVKNKTGWFSLSEDERKIARDRGRNTIVENKLGMFSDEYREKHKLTLHKKVYTPSGIFDSMTEAANYYNVVRGTITYRVNNKKWSDWYYV